jgi:tetratricopeptide (TPR) repeat protein
VRKWGAFTAEVSPIVSPLLLLVRAAAATDRSSKCEHREPGEGVCAPRRSLAAGLGADLRQSAATARRSAGEEQEALADSRRQEAEKQAVLATQLAIKKRDLARAVSLFEEALENPDLPPFAYVNALYAVNLAVEKNVRIEPARIRKLLSTTLAQWGLHGDGHLNAAFCFMRLGEQDSALAQLRKAKKKGVKLKQHLTDRAFAPLSTDKRFLALVRSSQ